MFKNRHELTKYAILVTIPGRYSEKKLPIVCNIFLREVNVFSIKMNTVLIAFVLPIFPRDDAGTFASFHCYPTCVTWKTSPKMREVSNQYSQHRVTCSSSRNFTVFVFFLPFFVMLLF